MRDTRIYESQREKEIEKKKKKKIDTFEAKKPFVSSGPCHERN